MATTETQIGVNTNLQKQDLSNLDIANLTALSPEVISRQATINIGTIGHVAHGKSTVVKAISGVQTVRFKNELERNITIKLARLSNKEIQKLLTSPTYLRQFEERQKRKMESWRRKEAAQFYNNFNDFYRAAIDASQRTKSQYYHNYHHYGSAHNLFDSSDYSSLTYLRGNSTSPSSGYGSICGGNEDTKSITSTASNITPRSSYKKGKSSDNKKSLKRRYSEISSSGCSTPVREYEEVKKKRYSQTPRIPVKKGEYIIEDIESVESIKGFPVFFVKWLNYPASQNTWESMDNLNDCAILEEFIENRYIYFETVIAQIIAEIEYDIEREQLTFDSSKLDMAVLDKFEPLKLKADLILLAQFREARSKDKLQTEKIRQRVTEVLLMKPFYYLRKQQKQEMEDFLEKMNKVEHEAPINVENNVDLDVPEPGFVYIKKSFPGEGVITTNDAPVGCSCENGECQPSTKCCARLAGNFFAYDKSGRLRIRIGEAIYECNNRCSCDDSCCNRVIQKGRKNSLCLFKTSNGCGWGVRTEKPMRKGDFVCEYVGEIITCDQANERGKLYDAKGRTYLFDLDYNTTQESMYTIDAAVYGNISHFINHSCDPNLAVFPYWINNLDINMPGLAFFTLRQIKAGEELTFDYIRSDLEEKAEDNAYQNLSDAEKVSCRCGAEKCRKVLF